MIEAALFDIGNVLVRFDYSKAVNGLARHSALTPEEVRAALDHFHPDHETGKISSEDYAARVSERIGYTGTPISFQQVYNDIFTVHPPMWEFIAGLPEHIRRVLFSNTSEFHQNWLFEWHPDFHGFHDGVYSWSALSMKPEEEIYRLALEKLNLPPDRVAYIDDLPANIETGRRLGLRAIQYHPDRHEDFLREVRAIGLGV